MGGEYTEHRDRDGNVTGWSKKEHGPFRGDYVEHHDADGRVIGSSNRAHDPITGDYVEHHDRDGWTTGWSRDQEDPLTGKYTEHHGTSYHYSDNEQADEPRSGGGSSSGGSGAGGAAAGAAIFLIPILLLCGIGWAIFAFFRWVVMSVVETYHHYRRLDKQGKRDYGRVIIVQFMLTAIVLLSLPLLYVYRVQLGHIFMDKSPVVIPVNDRATITIPVNDGWQISCWRNGDKNYRAYCTANKDNVHINLGEQEPVSVFLSALQTTYGWYDYQHASLEIDGMPIVREKVYDSYIIKSMMKGKIAKMRFVKDKDRNYPKGAPESINHTMQLGNVTEVYSRLEQTFKERFKITPPDGKTWLLPYTDPLMISTATIDGWEIECKNTKTHRIRCSASKGNLSITLTNVDTASIEETQFGISINCTKFSSGLSLRIDDGHTFRQEGCFIWHDGKYTSTPANPILQRLLIGKVATTHYMDNWGIDQKIQLGNFSEVYSTLNRMYHEQSTSDKPLNKAHE